MMNQENHISGNDEPGYYDVENFNILERPEAQQAGVPLYIAHWHIFIPTIIVTGLYFIAWIILHATGMGQSGLARISFLVIAIGVPFMTAYAFLRYQTIRVQINENDIICHPGWPKDLPIDVPISIISRVRVKRGLVGRLFGGGTLLLQLSTGSTVLIPDLRDVRDACKAIESLIENPS